MREYILAVAILGCFITLVPQTVSGSNVAFDSAGDSAYNNGWAQGSNGGYGWGAGWNFIDPSDRQSIATAAVASDDSQGGIVNSPATTLGRSWEVENGVATRFLSPAPLPSQPAQVLLQAGETLSFDVDAPSRVFNVGLGARDLSSAIELIGSGTGDYIFENLPLDGRIGFPVSTGIPIINGPIHISISNNGPADNYLFTASFSSLIPGAGVSTYSFYPFAALEQFYAASSDSSDPIYLNNITITPEPSVICLAGLTTLGLLLRRTRSPKRI